jgi:electron transfer flavoprotein alpha subunit
MAGGILVLAERRGGELKRPTLEAISVGRGLADRLGVLVDVLVLGPGGSALAEVVRRCGADRLLLCEEAWLEPYVPEAYAAAVAEVARAQEVRLVLAGGTSLGRDVLPRAAARLQAGCLSDLVAIEADPDGRVRGRRPVYSGKAFAWVAATTRPVLATLRPNVFPIETRAFEGAAELVPVRCPLGPDQVRVRAVRLERAPTQRLDVAEASVIVSGGRGLKAPENFALIQQLAEVLGGAVGASRAVVDAGWIPHSHQVGQTGKVVSPTLYIACGISGAIQHLAGMSSSKVIVAINKDPEAPIFRVADYGIVGDLFEIVPKLTEEIRRLKTGG